MHPGDGVQAAFYDDPRVLTISLHEHPATLFPGTGLPGETGTGAGEGYAVNVALPAGTGDAGWLRALDAVALPLLRAFKPTVLVSQHGCDSHRLDPLRCETAPGRPTDCGFRCAASSSSGADPSDPVDRAIMQTQSAVFPAHGLLAQLSSAARPGCLQHGRDVLLSAFSENQQGGRKGLGSASAARVSTLRLLRVLALFRMRPTLGYVRDWCAESGQACSASRERGQ